MTGSTPHVMANPQESKSSSTGDKKLSVQELGAGLMAPTSPPYPPYGTYIDHQHAANGFDPNDLQLYSGAYVYPLSPQFSVQYYPDFGNGYQSYPGSPSRHPQSPPINPTSPPFSPTFQYQQGGLTLSPPTHAYVLPPHSASHFPPLHILIAPPDWHCVPPHQYTQPFSIRQS